jgi:hypothetical protein
MKKICIAVILTAVLLVSGCGSLSRKVSPLPSATPAATPSSSPSESAQPTSSPTPTTAGADEVGVADYFPFKANVYMTYRGTGNEYAAFESWVDYIGNDAIQIRTNNGGTESVSVYTIDDGAVTRVFSEGEIYYRYDYTAERTENDIIIMEPIAVGTSWTLSTGEKRSITATDADITVPYGAFKALEVTTEYENSTTKDYYVLDLGLVKKEFTAKDTPSMTITSDLEKYEEGSPLIENARFYYPDFNNNRVAYINIGLKFYTGGNFMPQLESFFKNPPSGLARVMTENASIKSITLDRNSGVVTVDFNKQFVTEMNAGTSYEGMILSSIANTLGSYFLTDKVQITVEGGPYESGHFLFNFGDYLPYSPEDAVEYQG